MSGLVTRLQKQAERGTYIPDGPKLILEAIAEIESLRSRLAEAHAALQLAADSIGRFVSDEGSTERDHRILDTVLAALPAATDSASGVQYKPCEICTTQSWCETHGCQCYPVSAVQPERCCVDYPRCDCNSPPEPDNEWHCSQYPGCECFAGCREKALEAAP